MQITELADLIRGLEQTVRGLEQAVETKIGKVEKSVHKALQATEESLRAEVRDARNDLTQRIQRVETLIIGLARASRPQIEVEELLETGRIASAELPEKVRNARRR